MSDEEQTLRIKPREALPNQWTSSSNPYDNPMQWSTSYDIPEDESKSYTFKFWRLEVTLKWLKRS